MQHAPQFPNLGAGQEYELLQWLDNVVFPMEAKFKDADFAAKAYARIVKRYIDAGVCISVFLLFLSPSTGHIPIFSTVRHPVH